MKYILIALCLFGVVLVACEHKAVVDDVNTPQGIAGEFIPLDSVDMQLISLIDYDLNLSIQLPIVANSLGKVIEPVVLHDDGDYLWFIHIGDYFKIVVEDYANEFGKVVAAKKLNESQSNMFEFVYFIDEMDLIFYSRQLIGENGGEKTYHCLREMKIDGYNYILRTEKTGSSLKSVVQDMVSAIKTAKHVK
ncbi:hypothetical protein DNU06_10400 [Putridiphycobacter roseus]|uniref:Uncharacterized protein n=1 Tax=Putridiphycobacter roseus TaxID=2219161 RepID=A0A2W1NDF2_9FLAO|nr:hypothetical protein [Putridiphycobacter roseus]PZE17143.1 hypothetical protein DNU06_10400 [Putridiphycobacter roseus]